MNDASFLGSGWSFPPTFEVGNYRLNMSYKMTTGQMTPAEILASLLPKQSAGQA